MNGGVNRFRENSRKKKWENESRGERENKEKRDEGRVKERVRSDLEGRVAPRPRDEGYRKGWEEKRNGIEEKRRDEAENARLCRERRRCYVATRWLEPKLEAKVV